MTEQDNILRDIDTLRALIEADLQSLTSASLSADQRRVIKDHLDMLISDYQTLRVG